MPSELGYIAHCLILVFNDGAVTLNVQVVGTNTPIGYQSNFYGHLIGSCIWN